ncbi:hypothetical protein RhiirA1_477668 [Rhizophagus irregularis]|uniref:Uncharacterized protein n=3 Tax=Rhizophagus irregularis TaxID=588596 RepID=A0A2N0QT99_9GLOM|nr:hypothetical protein GLOIN_2v1770865 [Rhizophagus irregularis DAOM 181602=DAOM 197198]EXX58165.1 hypothetical protein RirG_200440 [Rhizophagus irregularis DAOM 197198w]PKC54266.1 hypothetical protein RhiirA1_477668 [Rhizophagus irregularis]POG74814.1 hypothetical protein GLOIN_2v1770865 [Rhizophagus irregularis DAOM 181602=DAOM 197198]UZO23446.1 hypothetical protein OCT59_015786 [Rhizophagus irregularis]CAB5208809.1 unnamed protein product [Rhizophagus irregularis]|eukprot:XP_025181680.1 hypothetical protein GLOIN_2v1770865 [Rhizophagus irregularis DAOM 181602=DAOM 197198]
MGQSAEIAVPNAWFSSTIIVILGVGITFDIPGIGSAFNVSDTDSYNTSSAVIIVLGVGITFNVLSIGSAFNVSVTSGCDTGSVFG